MYSKLIRVYQQGINVCLPVTNCWCQWRNWVWLVGWLVRLVTGLCEACDYGMSSNIEGDLGWDESFLLTFWDSGFPPFRKGPVTQSLMSRRPLRDRDNFPLTAQSSAGSSNFFQNPQSARFFSLIPPLIIWPTGLEKKSWIRHIPSEY